MKLKNCDFSVISATNIDITSFIELNQGRGQRLLKNSYLDHTTKSDVTSGLKLRRAARFTKRKNGVWIGENFLLFVNHHVRFLSN